MTFRNPPLAFVGLPLPPRSLIGMQEKLSLLGEREIARTVSGGAVLLQPDYGSLYAIELSNSGPGVWLPHQFRPGDVHRYHCQTWQTVSANASEQQVFLGRDPSYVHARDTETGDEVEIVWLSGRSVTLPARGRPTTIAYRMTITVMVADYQSSGSATGREQSWTLKMEEVY